MVLEVRCQEILNQLLSHDGYIPIQDLAAEKNISKRSVYYDLCKINDFLNAHKIDEVQLKRNRGIFLDDDQKEKVQIIFNKDALKQDIYFSPMQRVKLIICLMMISKHVLLIEDFMEACQVSRNTIINDLKVVSAKLNENGLALHYGHRSGYTVKGEVIRKRALYFLFFPELAESFRMGQLPMLQDESLQKNLAKLEYIEEKLETKYVENTLLALASFIPVLERNEDVLAFSDVDRKQIIDSYEYKLAENEFGHLSISEKIYLTLHLLGSRLQALPIDIFNADENQEPYELAKALVSEFSRIACIEFEHPEEIERSIFVHLKSSLYRYRYGTQLGNPLIDDIKDQYPELFEITKKAAEYLIQQVGVPINDNEIAYLTLHFGAHIRPNQMADSMRILIVCPNGISTGNMLRGEVSALVPDADAIQVISLSELEAVKDGYDVIISTAYIGNQPDILLVHPILTDTDRIQILKKCMRTVGKTHITAENIFDVVKKFIPENMHPQAKKDIRLHLEDFSMVPYPPLKDNKRGLLSFLDKHSIRFKKTASDWKSAIRIACEPLLEDGSIETSYMEGIIDQTCTLGPYMFLSKDVMLAHTKSEAGANKLGLAVTLFKEAVPFPKEKSAKLIFVLSAEDQIKHLKILKDIMKLLSDANCRKILFGTATSEEFIAGADKILNG